VAGGIGDAEFAGGSGEEAIGDVYGDALLAFGVETVGEKGEVDLAAAAVDLALFDSFDLVFVGTFGVEEEAADESALTVVNAAGGGEAEGGLHLEIALALFDFH